MCRMTEKLAPTVIGSQVQFGRLLLVLKTFAGWSNRVAAQKYGCCPALISLRERGMRALTVQQAVDVIDHHGYVLVMMSKDDAVLLHRLRHHNWPRVEPESVGA